MADRLKNQINKDLIITKFVGDEFTALRKNPADIKEAARYATEVNSYIHLNPMKIKYAKNSRTMRRSAILCI